MPAVLQSVRTPHRYTDRDLDRGVYIRAYAERVRVPDLPAADLADLAVRQVGDPCHTLQYNHPGHGTEQAGARIQRAARQRQDIVYAAFPVCAALQEHIHELPLPDPREIREAARRERAGSQAADNRRFDPGHRRGHAVLP